MRALLIAVLRRIGWYWPSRIVFIWTAADRFIDERWAAGLLWLFALVFLMLVQIEGQVRDLRRRGEGTGT